MNLDDVHAPTPEELRAAGFPSEVFSSGPIIISPSTHAAMSNPLGRIRLAVEGFVASSPPTRPNRRTRRAQAAKERRR